LSDSTGGSLDSSDSELELDFGFGAGRLTGSIDRNVGASLVARREVFELESGLVTVGRDGFSLRTISVFFGCEFFLRVSGEGILLVDATSLRRGRRVSCPEDSEGLSSVVFLDDVTFVAGLGVLLAGCFLISVWSRATRARGGFGRSELFAFRGSVCVSRELTDWLCDSLRFGRASFVTDVFGISRDTFFTTLRSADFDDDREIVSASAAAGIAAQFAVSFRVDSFAATQSGWTVGPASAVQQTSLGNFAV